MTMALAVALVACSAATSVKGEQGPQGAQGETGPAGPAGESSNEPPMAVADMPLKDVYLALGGAGEKPESGDISLSGHFSDKEKASLTFEAMSSDMMVAEVKVTDSNLVVTGKGAGSATVTVSAYDGVNTDPATASFEVMVVTSNVGPTVTFPGTDTTFVAANGLDALQAKIYTANGPVMVPVMVNIDPGVAGDLADAVTVKAVMGVKGAKDDIVSVGLEEKKRGTWEITLTPKAEGKQTVQLMVEDMFGASADFGETFIVLVNTVPKLVTPLPDKAVASGGAAIGNLPATLTYAAAEFFDFGEVAPTGAAASEEVAGESTETPAAETDADHTCTASINDTTIAEVAVADDVATVTPADPAKPGKVELTITCSDTEASVSSSAMITVR